MLKDLQKKQNKKSYEGQVLKAGVLLLFNTQEQFNQLCSFFPELQEDSILIDDDYCAYMDEYPALQVQPLSEFSEDIENIIEAFEHRNLKPIDFDKWFKKFK